MRIHVRDATPDSVTDGLRRDGYAIVEGVLAPDELARAREDLARVLATTPTGRNNFEGFSTRRVYALFRKTRAFDAAAVHPLALGVLDRVLGQYQFSAPVGIQIGPGEAAQVLHRDEAVYPLPRPHPPVVINTMWPLDDFTADNGATRLVAGSHTWDAGRSPDASSEMIVAEMPAGSVMFYLGNLWHGGGANRTERPRLGVILEYVVSWLRPQENHCLAVPRRIARELPVRLQELLGYNIFPPFVGYVDGTHPRKVLEQEE
ncbi:MAG TPA: phytanoyl-CoA dioxygenase family protein [Polyangiaceae bacterium]|jgi:ectoine hydroxylase-related dioxygenase (phytanoyl-CoA dioxygenase family)